MQVEDHAGYKVGDVWTRWLPAYDKMEYHAAMTVCRRAIAHWQKQQRKAEGRIKVVRSSTTRKRWTDRHDWCRANVNRWQNSLREVMIKHGRLKQDRVPF